MNKRNLHWIVEIDKDIKLKNSDFRWLTLWEIKRLVDQVQLLVLI